MEYLPEMIMDLIFAAFMFKCMFMMIAKQKKQSYDKELNDRLMRL